MIFSILNKSNQIVCRIARLSLLAIELVTLAQSPVAASGQSRAHASHTGTGGATPLRGDLKTISGPGRGRSRRTSNRAAIRRVQIGGAAGSRAFDVGSGWVEHYLPDDRAHVLGFWKYVTTEDDDHFHMANSPEMLSRSPDHLLGFVTRREVEEAGYLPGPSVLADDSRMGVTRTLGSTTENSGGAPASLDLTESQIPKAALRFFYLVLNTADEIEKTSSQSDLIGIRLKVAGWEFEARQGLNSATLSTGVGPTIPQHTVLVCFRFLKEAAANKSAANPIARPFSRFALNEARKQAINLIPQARAFQARWPGKNFTLTIR